MPERDSSVRESSTCACASELAVDGDVAGAEGQE